MVPILIGDLGLRWIVTALFGVSIATYVYALVTQCGRWTNTVNHLLHLVMSAAMILMAWRVGLNLPTIGPVIFFLLTVGWFMHAASRASCTTRRRLTNCYYAVMMMAMAWMYALMNSSLPGQIGHPHDHAQHGSLATNMSGMETPAQQMSLRASGPGWITVVNWTVALGFAAVAVYWPCHHFVRRRVNSRPSAPRLAHVELLYQATAAAGTALMFVVML